MDVTERARTFDLCLTSLRQVFADWRSSRYQTFPVQQVRFTPYDRTGNHGMALVQAPSAAQPTAHASLFPKEGDGTVIQQLDLHRRTEDPGLNCYTLTQYLDE